MFCVEHSARGRARLRARLLRVYVAVYVVARFWPLLLSFFFARPSWRTRGISLLCILSAERICSARSPSFLPFTSATTWSSALAICSGERRARRPDLRARVAAGAAGAALDFGGRPGPRLAPLPESASSSSRLAPRMAFRTAEAKSEARDSRLVRRDIKRMYAERREIVNRYLAVEYPMT